MKFEEPTSNTDISGKTKNDKTLLKNYNITYFEINFVFNEVLCPHLQSHDGNDYTTLLSELSSVDFEIVCLLN